ncbi:MULTISPECIES: zinc metalloprotease HtpX [Streptacidiphilus]|uniref:Protease HtpX homolog n=1 Tax=Streptacidiphilus cavernicola TaxID=3342716 RepID=A0ABV6V0R1_9ACTN|nr:zinc metalloprotease HtpX [Streptacidiphilus jeojiense]
MSANQGRFAPDRGLTARMLLTLFLLGLLYVGFMAALVVLLRSWIAVVLIAAGLLAAQYWFSDRIALFALHAHEVSAEEQPQLHGLVDRLCTMADLPKPRIAVAETDLPNAFATGRSADHAVLCVTTGLLRRLEADELEGVVAHELSHLAHRDVAVITVASFLGVLAGLLVRFAFYSQLLRGRRDPTSAALIGAVVGVSAGVYVISFLLIRSLSRYRELAADRSAAQLTGRPSALASALTKVSGEIARIPDKDLRTTQPFNAFLFTPADGKGGPGVMRLFSTHPSLERRLEELAKISSNLNQPVA